MQAHRTYVAQSHFSSLNGLRFLCIIAVVWHHAPGNGLTDGLPILERGFVGVDFFFVLSGFLITTLLLREEARTGRVSLIAFYRRRALRILPAYLLLVTAVSLYWIFVKGRADLAALAPYYYAFLANFLTADIPLLSITWSLSIEEQYYLVWPALLLLLPSVGPARIATLVLMMTLCVLAMLGLGHWLGLPRLRTDHAVFVWPGMSYLAILCGSLTAVVLHHPKGFSLLWRICGWAGAPVAFLAALLTYLHLAPTVLTGWPALGMDVLMALCLASLVIREDHVLRPAMTVSPVARIGTISYGLYLYHLIGLHVANEVVGQLGLGPAQTGWAVTMIYPLVSIALAEASFRFFERHFLEMKTRPLSKTASTSATR